MNAAKDRSPFIYAIVGILFLFLSTTVPLSAQTNWTNDLIERINQYAVWDPADFILDKLCKNRIVMLGDGGHGDPLYSRVVISSLNHWISAWERDEVRDGLAGLPPKIFLFLEMDSVRADALKQYFQTGNPIQTIAPVRFLGDQFTTGTLEFYNDLRMLSLRVDKYNRSNRRKSPLSFDVVGPEKVIDVSNWTIAKRDSFFVWQRDEYSSAKVIDLLERVSDAKALLYYGDAHLIAEKTQKSERANSLGYFLAHYLKESFAAKGGAYTCGQLEVSANPRYYHGISKIGKTFAINNSILTGIAIEPNASFQPRNGTIFHFAAPRHSAHLSTLLSENLVDYILDTIDAYKDNANEFYRGLLDTWLFYLSNLAVVDFNQLNHANASAVDSTIKAWKKWRSSTRIDLVEELSSLRYFKRYVDLIRASDQRKATWYQMRLGQLTGFKVWFPNDVSPQVRADSIWTYINRYRKPIVTQSLINMLWIGSKAENEKAQIVLKKETGQNCRNAKEWTEWWEAQQSN
jgi:hypothetical protein